MVKKIFILIFSFVCLEGFSQRSFPKHQIGINASKFIILFNEQVDNLDISYRLALDSTNNLRTALSLDASSADSGISDLAFRLGLDRYISTDNNWRFYYGLDLNYSRNLIRSSKRTNSNYGVLGFFGVLLQLGNHFSLSTEPTLAYQRYKTTDEDDFGPQANSSWYELKLLNIGQVKISFHF